LRLVRRPLRPDPRIPMTEYVGVRNGKSKPCGPFSARFKGLTEARAPRWGKPSAPGRRGRTPKNFAAETRVAFADGVGERLRVAAPRSQASDLLALFGAHESGVS